jgi:peptide deformylase
MYQTMYEASGIGLAAPQIGKSIRMFIVDVSPFAYDQEEDPRAVDMEDFKKVFINPIIESETGEKWAFLKDACQFRQSAKKFFVTRQF